MTGTVLTVVLLATLLESTVEYVLGLWWQPWKPEVRKSIIQILTLVLGIGIAWFAQLDLLKLAGVEIPVVGVLLTGGLIGRGSDVVHQFIQKWVTPK